MNTSPKIQLPQFYAVRWCTNIVIGNMDKKTRRSFAETLSSSQINTKWLLDAIRKIKQQKQRPCLDRISHVIKQQHGDISQDVICSQLEAAVQLGEILKVYNKGIWSYKDPTRVTSQPTRTLKVNRKSDLTKIIIKCIRELGEPEGSTLKNIEKYVRRSYTLDFVDNINLTHQLRISAKRAVNSGRLENQDRRYKVGIGDTNESGSCKEINRNESISKDLVDMAALQTKNKVYSKLISQSK